MWIYSLIWGSCGLIFGLFLGFILFLVVYREVIKRGIYLWVKRQEQAMSVDTRRVNQMSEKILLDLMNNSVNIIGFNLPLGDWAKEKAPGAFKFALDMAKKNPEQFWFTMGKTIIPMAMGIASRQAGSSGGGVAVSQGLEKYLSPQMNLSLHGSEKKSEPQDPPTGETYASEIISKPGAELRP